MASAFRKAGSVKFFARIRIDAKWIDSRWRGGKRVTRVTAATTLTEARAIARALQAKVERVALGLEAPERSGMLVGPLMERWAAKLDNRAADIDRGRINLHVLPRWRAARVEDVDLAAVMRWLDDMRDAKRIGPGSQRHALGLLSRFFSWAVERGHAQRNPCRDVPAGRRPRSVPPRPEETPWLQSDDDVLRVMRALPAPFDLIFFVGNRSAARLSEILALRLSDLGEIGQGAIRVRFAGDDGRGPLKEDKFGAGKVKHAPIPAADALAVLGPIIERRRADGAGPEDFVFVDADGDRIDRHTIKHRWGKVRASLGLPAGLSFYRATRHSAVSRSLAMGASADEVAAMCGHSAPSITLKHYAHFQRRRFSPILCAGLGLDGAPAAKVIAIDARSVVTGKRAPARASTAKKGRRVHAA